ncbi:hypothetical protein Tco_1419467 [Tanacetum coccineum]
MEDECYFGAKLKRKEIDHHDDDAFYDYIASSPATKIRRLDAELPPIIEEEEMSNAACEDGFVEEIVRGSNVTINELPENEERAIVLYDPLNNVPRSPISVSVNSDFLSGFKNPVVWSNRSNLLQSLVDKTEKQDSDSEQNKGSLAVVPWVAKSAHHQAMPEVEVPHTEEVSDMMDADDMETTTMDIEDNNYQQIPKNSFGSVGASEGVNQWQQHCMIPQPPQNMATPIAWSAAFFS